MGTDIIPVYPEDELLAKRRRHRIQTKAAELRNTLYAYKAEAEAQHGKGWTQCFLELLNILIEDKKR